MLFTSAEFLIFLVAVQAAYRFAPEAWRRSILLVASYWFYMSWGPVYGLLLAATTLFNWFAGSLIARGRHPRAVVTGAVIGNLGLLGFYKYTGFLLQNLEALGVPGVDAGRWSIVLPLGISFFTFQGLSYVVDVYRDHRIHVRSFSDMLLFKAWFPQLVAGPIVRAPEIVHQFAHLKPPGFAAWQSGMWLALRGFFKKAVIADNLALVVDPAFTDHAHWDSTTAWIVMLAYALQIYFDFSGYSEIALGLSRTFGIDLPVNFRNPYASASITEFWRRWHITLSSWLRDYLYIPLGGNRQGRLMQYRNQMITMLLGGLWHGASWNFVLWGGYHGLLLGVHKLWRSLAPKALLARLDASLLWRVFAVTGTFALVVFSWVPFRAQTFPQTLDILRLMVADLSFGAVPREILGSVALVVVATYGLYRLGRLLADRTAAGRGLLAWGAARPALSLAVMTHVSLLTFALSVSGKSPFIYFQF